jgi:succinate dehydrogenase / fumarate reductase membrane anchor subunit
MSVYVLEGLRPWVVQRVSAVYITLFILYLLYCGFTAEQTNFEQWRAWLFEPLNSVGVGLLIIAVLFHAWIGIRDVVLDYVHDIMLRIFVLALVIGVLAGSGLWAFRILLLSVVN